MKLFNMIESFFFLSLGVAFVLLLLLVYHFRQRVNSIEQKCDTMFEIINNVVGELNSVRSHAIMPPPPMPLSMEQVMGLSDGGKIPVSITNSRSGDSDEEDSDGEDSDEEDSDGEDSDGEDSDGDDSDGDDSDGDDSDGDDSDEEDLPDLIPLTDTVRIVNVDMEGPMNVAESDNEQEVEVDVESLLEKLDSDGIQKDNITVEKIEEAVEQPGPIADLAENMPTSILSEPQDIYKKMNIGSLRALVIEKGLISDPSKLKKQELIALLVPSTD